MTQNELKQLNTILNDVKKQFEDALKDEQYFRSIGDIETAKFCKGKANAYQNTSFGLVQFIANNI